MALDVSKLSLLVAVGSRHDRVCSIGAFARAEAKALSGAFKKVEILEPDSEDRYPRHETIGRPDVVIFHAPALHDRIRPWNAIVSALKLKRAFPDALLVPVVHEYAEAPNHWRARQILIAAFSDALITNTAPDYAGISRWSSKVLRCPLGPTLYYEELLAPQSPQSRSMRLVSVRSKAREDVLQAWGGKAGLRPGETWVLHPGLLTPGKGVNFLGKLEPFLPGSARLLLMGGFGPKQRDREFASQVLSELRDKMKGRLSFIESPDDETYRKFLVASDLVVLPYDAGLSERRSSFLSAMCCGANVWTTTGPFSAPLDARLSGAHAVTREQWTGGDPHALRSVADALAESDDEMLLRRVKNLAWAMPRSWESRTRNVASFISGLR